MAMENLETTCCIAGGGPAGMMLGYLLARSGVPVTVLEMHKDFFRDFRGDTVHPSTLEVLKELGLLEEFLALPHQTVTHLNAIVGDSTFKIGDFGHVPGTCKFVALVPQWDFLNFLSDHAWRFPSFRLLMEHQVVGLDKDGERITGVLARNGERELRIRADLVVGCDGRHSTTRTAAGLDLVEFGVPIDVLWFRISRRPYDTEQLLGNVNYGRALILINRFDYFQAGFIIKKGSYDEVRERGIEAFQNDLRRIAPFLGERVYEIHSWQQIRTLTVQINRLRQWYLPGLLCIGDAAHAMSPAGGVGINLAIQDAVAAANVLISPLLDRSVSEAHLAAIQKRREIPTRVTQKMQLYAHRGLARVFEQPGPLQAPWQLKVATRIPGIQRALGYAVGIGVRPEHVRDRRREEPRPFGLAKAIFSGAGLVAGAALVGWAVWKLARGVAEASSRGFSAAA